MSSKVVVTACMDLVKQACTSIGVDLVDLEYEKRPDGYHLVVTIDRDGGVDLDACEKVARLLDEPLDKLDPTGGASYHLDVMSCGLDRPLKVDRDFKRNIGSEVRVKLYAPDKNKCKEYCGVLKSYSDKDICISKDSGEVKINRADIALVEPVIKF